MLVFYVLTSHVLTNPVRISYHTDVCQINISLRFGLTLLTTIVGHKLYKYLNRPVVIAEFCQVLNFLHGNAVCSRLS